MTADLKTQIRDFAQGFASVLPPIEFEELMRSQVVARSQPPKRRRGWVVALATAAAVLVLVGGVALLLDSADPVPPVVTQPPTPTTTVPVTVAPDSPVTETTAITVETTLAGSLEPPSPSTTLSTANSVLSDEPISGDDLGVAIAVSSSIADIRVGRDAVGWATLRTLPSTGSTRLRTR